MLATVFMLVGCGGGGGGTTAKSNVKVINAIPDLGATLETQINGLIAGTSSAYLADTAFFSIEPADVDLAIKETGTVEDFDILANVFNSNASYIVAGMGIKNFSTEFKKRPRIGLFEVNRAEPNGSKARVFVLNALRRSRRISQPGHRFPRRRSPPLPFQRHRVLEGESADPRHRDLHLRSKSKRFRTRLRFVSADLPERQGLLRRRRWRCERNWYFGTYDPRFRTARG